MYISKGSKTANQYFQVMPDKNLLHKVLVCFHMKDIEYNKIISKLHISEYDVIRSMEELLPELSKHYYSNRMYHFFFYSPLTFMNCITILRNVLLSFEHTLVSKHIMVKNKNIICYTINKIGTEVTQFNQLTFKINFGKKILIEFD